MNIDKKLENYILKESGHVSNPESLKAVSQIKQSILKAIEEVRPDNQDDQHYNEALDDYDNRIFNLLSEAKK